MIKKFFIFTVVFLILELFVRVAMPAYSDRYIYEISDKNMINMFGIKCFMNNLIKIVQI